MKKTILALAAVSFANFSVQATSVTNLIDSLATGQLIAATNTTVTNTILSPGSIGGYRTITVGASGSPTAVAGFGVDTWVTPPALSLFTPTDVVSTYSVIWGGLGGTNGLGGLQLGGGEPLDLSASFLAFALKSMDQQSSLTWTMTDTSSVSASYSAIFDAYNPTATGPATNVSIALASFANANSINWNAINFISLSGGNVSALDLSMEGPIQVVSTIPEPGSVALLATGLSLTALFLRRRRGEEQ